MANRNREALVGFQNRNREFETLGLDGVQILKKDLLTHFIELL
jgi:hypothetical protein